MKINWFSPLPPAATSIAHYTAAILPALAQRAEVTLWTDRAEWTPELERCARVRHYDLAAIPWPQINAADVSIFQLGNNPDFHTSIWQVSRQHPGIVVLHDTKVQQFFAALAVRNLGLSGDEYREMMRYHHPEAGDEAALDVLSGRQTPEAICHRFPLTDAAVENATGVVVHTDLAREHFTESSALPVAYLPLVIAPSSFTGSEQAARNSPNERRRLIMFGFLGPNRRLLQVLQALRDFPERERFHLDVYGSVADAEGIARTIGESGLGSLVSMHGYVPADELDRALARADLAINLRSPSMGEASSAQLRIWQHALPSLVTAAGWYGTLPANTVALVRPENELEDIRRHLATFLSVPQVYRRLGENGRRFFEEHHTMERYLDGLFALIEETNRGASEQAVTWMAGRTGQKMRPWFDEDAAEIVLPSLARRLQQIFR